MSKLYQKYPNIVVPREIRKKKIINNYYSINMWALREDVKSDAFEDDRRKGRDGDMIDGTMRPRLSKGRTRASSCVQDKTLN